MVHNQCSVYDISVMHISVSLNNFITKSGSFLFLNLNRKLNKKNYVFGDTTELYTHFVHSSQNVTSAEAALSDIFKIVSRYIYVKY